MNIVAYSDSDFAGNKEYIISVSGLIIILNDAPIIWSSKAHRSVTLSSSEAEYVLLSESSKEVKLIWMLLKSTSLEVKPEITVRIDNVGAIFISETLLQATGTSMWILDTGL